jgi:putrescine aminotransferase
MGRLGAWWGADLEGVAPDVLLVGKGLSGGVVPVGAVVATDAAFAPLNREPLLHSSTFAGNPLAMVAAQAAIETIEQENLTKRAGQLGKHILQTLTEIMRTYCAGLVREVRGAGLLIGIEFEEEHLAGDFMIKLLEQKVIVSHSLNAHKVLRLTPPAILTEADCQWLFTAVEYVAIELSVTWKP